jgi:PAS domain S-box-containing protein
VTFLDITDRKRTETEVHASEAQLRALLTSTPAIIFTTDLQGHIQQINRTLPGLTLEMVVGTSVLAFADPRDRSVVMDAIERVGRTGEIFGYESRGPPDFPPARYSVRIAPVKIEDRIVGLIFNALEVTEQRELQNRIMVSDRMASVGTLAAGIAHEINNPLTFLMSSLSWVLRELESEASALDRPSMVVRLRHAAEGADRIRDIVRDLSTFTKSRDEEARPIDLHRVIESAIRMANNELRYRARLVREFGDVPPVLANESRLGQVVLNLLVNAGQAIVEGAVEQNQVRVCTGVAPDGRVLIEVTDTGSGITDDVVDNIFDPFVTTKAMAAGTGLGLYISHNIVRSLGGEIRAENVPGGGARLTVFVPAAAAIPEVAVPTPGCPPGRRRLRVLVVDDEEGIRLVLRHMLRGHHDVSLAASGREAVNRVEESSFDAVLCDLIMPDMTGMDVYNHLRRRHPRLADATVFMTGGAFTPRAREFLDQCHNVVLTKPFHEPDVLDALARIEAAEDEPPSA